MSNESSSNPPIRFGDGEACIRVGDEELLVASATSPISLIKGLSGIQDLGPYKGLLMDFGSPCRIALWSKGTYIPLDVVFLDEEGYVQELSYLPVSGYGSIVTPFTVISSVNCRFALEAYAGFIEEHNIQVGHKLDLQLFDN